MTRTNPLSLPRMLAVSAAVLMLTMTASRAEAVCGDGGLERTEQCDDGNVVSGDCCSSLCQFEAGGLPCEDDGKSCTTDTCDGQGSCSHFVGDNTCDDGNDCTLFDFCNADGFCANDGTAEDGSRCSDNSLCGGFGSCGGGTCVGDPADCSDFGSPCSPAACDSQKGTCYNTPLQDGAPCDDGTNCTDSTCSQGECLSTPTDCSSLDDACHVGLCNADGCFKSPKENGTPCDDNNGCTDTGQCADGICDSPLKDCSSFADQCNDAGCDQKSVDGCLAIPKDNGTTCNDGNGCTINDQCSDGFCNGTERSCAELDDACHVGVCNGELGGCQADLRPDGTTCDDGNLCTTGDQCSNGVCAGTTVDCSELDDACNIGTCSRGNGRCDTTARSNGTTCNDGNLCTTADQCIAGVCAGTTKDCSELDDACHTGTCSAASGQCVLTTNPNGATCNDGNLCTTGDQCSAGNCAGAAKDCSTLDDACHTGACNAGSGQCVANNKPNGATCDDGNLCTTGDQCSAGTCAGATKDCSVLDDACHTGACCGESARAGAVGRLCIAGQCYATDKPDGTACSDGNRCTTGDQCSAGSCAGSALDCSGSGASCVTGTCDPESGQCVGDPVENGTACDDADPCTANDQCNAGVCSGTPKDCTTLDDACHAGTCSSDSGECIAAARQDGTPCDDGDACTTTDRCTGGACAGTAVDCSGLTNACRTGVCSGTGACEAVAVTDGTPCNDGAFCTKTDTCIGGSCAGTGNSCELRPLCSNQCDEAADSCNSPAGMPCQDDGNPCTDDVCDGEGGCGAVANTGECDDNLYCTTADRCDDGQCIGDPTCPPTSACGDTCSEADKACRTCGHPFSNQRCIVNAVFVLQGALGLRECEVCTCDVNSSGDVTATDALMILRTCANLPSSLECPASGATTTTTLGGE